MGGLPIGLAHRLPLKNAVAAGKPVCWNDVNFDISNEAIRVRREMESIFKK
jgi:predicted homoserine dehydrogenase-like protein